MPFSLETVQRFGKEKNGLSKEEEEDLEKDAQIKQYAEQYEVEKYLDEAQEYARQKLGLAEILWLTIAKFLCFGYILLSVIVSFEKESFLSETAVCLGIFYFYNPENIRKFGFLCLTGMLFTSIIYDLFWVLFITDFGDNESGYEDRREAWIQLFSLRVLYVSMVWRVSSTFPLLYAFLNLIDIGTSGSGIPQAVPELCQIG